MDDVANHLFGEFCEIHAHRVDPAGLCDQRHDRTIIVRHQVSRDCLGRWHRTSESDTRDANVAHKRLSHVRARSEEHTSELQSLMRISYADFCLKKKKQLTRQQTITDYKHNIK